MPNVAFPSSRPVDTRNVSHPARRTSRSMLLMGAASLCITLTACSLDDDATLPDVDPVLFRTEVYPVLLRDCAFEACHGTSERLFQVYGPGRVRLPAESDDVEIFPLDPATEAEIELSFGRSKSMLLYRTSVSESPLLRKPLQGGAHEGIDAWGRNVYRDATDPGYAAMVRWAKGARAPESEEEEGSR